MKTINVDKDLCTKCGICSTVCITDIIEPGDERTLPRIAGKNAANCVLCGHCEAFCPTQALILNLRPEERQILPPDAGTVSPETMEFYLKKRRSIRHFLADSVPREKILKILDISRYAASGMNGQTVEWIVVHDPKKVQKIAGMTIKWMESLLNTAHPMSGYAPMLIAAWQQGRDVICRGAPHLLLAHIPENNPVAPVDAIIALTHFDIAAPSFDIGTCWAGFVAIAANSFVPIQKELGLPQGRKIAYAMMFGYPKFKVYGIPRRKPLSVSWK
jgi:nitroreductase/NAD-dependent dihydropyrimidine dehydrogenase PreA subunit